jgi:23S rRNA (uracil1939-C5)-methyltransferase
MSDVALDLPRGPRRGDQFEVAIDHLDLKGLGVGQIRVLVGPQDDDRTYDVRVRKAVPGDVLVAEVEKCRKGRIDARIVDFVTESKMRVEPRCRHFGVRGEADAGCGGCTLQSLDQRHQLAVKERIIKRLFAANGLDPGLVEPVMGMEDPWFYRNKMEFSFGTNADGNFGLGMHPSGYRYDVIRQEECFLMSEFVAAFVPRVRDWCAEVGLKPENRGEGWLKTLTVREGKRTGERLVELTTTHDEFAETAEGRAAPRALAEAFCAAARAAADELGEPLSSVYWTQHRAVRGEPTRLIERHLWGAEWLHEELELPGGHRLRFAIHPRAFFQPNTFGAEMIYADVIEQSGVMDGRASRVLDLYCGTGTIGMAMSPWADEVVGVELQPDAVDNARKNAADNGIDNVEFICGDVGEILERDGLRGDVVIVDPPRAGLLPFAHEQLEKVEAKRMVYVSCNPKALARDLPLLVEKGWTIERVQPVDQFPQTYHVETVVTLGRPTAPA